MGNITTRCGGGTKRTSPWYAHGILLCLDKKGLKLNVTLCAWLRQWQRPELLQRSDGWFRAMLPNATAYAAFQGYAGARWPKMVGPATTALMPAAKGWYDASSVGNTSYSNASSPLLYWTGPSTTGPMLTVSLA